MIETMTIEREYNSLKGELVELYKIRADFQVTYASIRQDSAQSPLLSIARDHYKNINLQVISRELRLNTVVELMDTAHGFERLLV
jgi:hypothetical protein